MDSTLGKRAGVWATLHCRSKSTVLRVGGLAMVLIVVLNLVVAQPSRTHAATSPLSVSSQDGIGLSLNTNGTVAGLQAGDAKLPTTGNPGGFSVRMTGGTPNIVANPSFESDTDSNGIPDGWRFTAASGRPSLDNSTAHAGARSVRVSLSDTATSGTVMTDIRVRPRTNYSLSVWFKTRNLKPSAPTTGLRDRSTARVIVEQIGTGGKIMAVSTAPSYTDTAPWHRQFVGFKTYASVKQIRVRALIDGGSGTVWIDDLRITELFQREAIPVRGTVRKLPDGRLHQGAWIAGQDMRLNANFQPARDHIRVDTTVTDMATVDTRATDKAFQITYTLPLDAVGWEWNDYFRRSRTISQGTYNYDTIQHGTVGFLLQTMSRYPMATLHNDRSAITIAVPLGSPRISRMRYVTGQGLSITFDLGVSRAATRLKSGATFSFLIYKSDPAWGMRASVKKYYSIFPGSFVRRTNPAREGAWFIAPDLDKLNDSWQDYGLGMNMVSLGMSSGQAWATWGLRYIDWDNARGIYAAAYNHQWMYYDPFDGDTFPSYAQVMAKLRSDARMTPTTEDEARRRDEAKAALHSTARDINGRLYYENYASRSVGYYQNLDLLPSAPLDWARAVQRHQVQRAIDLARSVGGRLDAIHLDSASGMRRWAAVDNYDRRHWAETTLPLTFSYDSGLVTARGIFAKYMQMRRMANFLHARGMILTANFHGNVARTGAYIGADQVDYFGHESGFRHFDRSARDVTLDSHAIQKRVLAYQRPISVLDLEIGYGKVPPETVDSIMQENLFYGVYTGAASGGTDPWLQDEYRPVFAKYTPMVRAIATAGWEPVTNARSSNKSVWVERFGYLSRNNLYLTIRNHTTAAQDYKLTVDLNADGLRGVQALQAHELTTDSAVKVTLNSTGTRATIVTTIPAETTHLLRFNASP